jgi:hypothetical protein
VGNPPSQCLVGQEIDVGFYMNGTLMNLAGDELWSTIPAAPDTVTTSCLYQNYTVSAVQMCGGGWDAQQLLRWNQTYVAYQGNANDAFFGTDIGRPGFVGGFTNGTVATETAATLFAPANYHPTIVPGATDAVFNAITGYPVLYPTAFPAAQYDLRAYTYGYIQDQAYQVYGNLGQVANSRINLVIGVNVTLDILFKKQHIITPTGANMSTRVRLFNDHEDLVAEWMSSEGTYTTASGFTRAADGTTQYPFGNLPAIPSPKPLNTYNYLPGGTTLLHVLMAGLPAVPGGAEQVGPFAYAAPKGTSYGDPIVSVTNACGFSINCFNNPGTSWNNPGYFPNYGIPGASDYQGSWTAEVDFVNWYLNNTVTLQQPLTDSLQAKSGNQYPNYYQPIAGLLMGESYHIIPGTTATSGISVTEDLAFSKAGVSENGKPIQMAWNHLGPYSQQGVWQISGAHNSGEASGIFEVDLNGLVTGYALAFNYVNEFRPLSWGTITVTGAGLPSSGLKFYTYDGIYEAYVPGTHGGASGSGTYKFVISSTGYATQTFSVAVSSGMTSRGTNVYLQESNIPIPEFSSTAIIAFSAFASSLCLLRRGRKPTG